MIQHENEMCPRVGALWRSCRFTPRYDTTEPSAALEAQLGRSWAISEQDKERLMVQQTYVQDVCLTCGRVIERHG
jgi:hypothetical protein